MQDALSEARGISSPLPSPCVGEAERYPLPRERKRQPQARKGRRAGYRGDGKRTGLFSFFPGRPCATTSKISANTCPHVPTGSPVILSAQEA
eukprot:scaffold14900_cov103-Isochrysis_galbana.AAC.2